MVGLEPVAAGGRVKPLRWEAPRPTDDGSTAEDAFSSIGHYIATPDGWFLVGQSGWKEAAGLDTVRSKAAAQADYEARIVAAILPPSLDGRETALREAMAIAILAGHFGDYRREELTADYGQPRFDMMTEIVEAIRAVSNPKDPENG